MRRIYLSEGYFTMEHINNYIKNHLTTKQYNLICNYFNNEFSENIYFKSITIGNENGYSYNELFLFDINNEDDKYMPVYIPNINTSSPYALMRLETNIESEEEEVYTNINEIKNIIMNGYNINKIIDIITK